VSTDWIAVMMSALALGVGVAHAETRDEEGQGRHHGEDALSGLHCRP
jgi:hypothetical protein